MLVHWTPFQFQREFEHWFGGNGKSVSGFAPKVDVVEDDHKFELFADLPGVKLEDLDIQIEKDVLTIRGERKLERSGERTAGAFSRAFTLPQHVDVEKIAASLKDGVLTLTLPKRPEAQPRQIKVAVSS